MMSFGRTTKNPLRLNNFKLCCLHAENPKFTGRLQFQIISDHHGGLPFLGLQVGKYASSKLSNEVFFK